MRFKEPLCRSRLHRNVYDGLRGLTSVLAVVMIVNAMSSANVTDDDSEICSGIVAVSTVAAAAEHDASSPEDQLLFFKVRGHTEAGASSLTFAVFTPAAPHHPLTNISYPIDRNRKPAACREYWQTKTTYQSDTLPESTRAVVVSFD